MAPTVLGGDTVPRVLLSQSVIAAQFEAFSLCEGFFVGCLR